ncbi:hypothetical protein F8388_022648 [Cannabis sativa]|uniref:Protein kinase domain-containing protein n=1 Tax=Cannabis sativa TaxID=3483 RepID=A0A7J6G2C1_CANSA|nr:hypothetical protein F8388_022648 [Cannabis sativa]
MQLMIHAIMFGQAFCINNNNSSSIATHKNSCLNSCGDFEIPYPFGLDDSCYLEPKYQFQIYCKNSKPYLFNTSYNVMNISVPDGKLTITGPVVRDCYSSDNGSRNSTPTRDITRALNEYFSVSFIENKFYSIGCDNLATINGFRNGNSYTTGCISSCSFADEVDLKSCSGVGCCKTSIPEELVNYNLKLGSYNNHSSVLSFNPCSYRFVMQEKEFNFSRLEDFSNVTNVPVVLDWAVGFNSCETAKRNMETYSCKENSVCINSASRSGYLCQCSEGYQGNPYLSNGCIDIDECKQKPNLCGNGTCKHLGSLFEESVGTLVKFYLRRALLPLSNCAELSGSTFGTFFLLIGLWHLMKFIIKRSNIKRKEIHFQRNGGLLLQQQLSTHEYSLEKTKLFISEELEKATNNFDMDRILGQGGQGTVHKGMLTDGRIVAVKKSKIEGEAKIAEFINEVVILSQINHRNIVKLLGCCLETEVPLLVYEFIPNGTLAHYLHDHDREFQMTWNMRLRIASEIAGALFYLHSATSSPIYHRDIKSTNILLDEKYRAKVADFGTSRTVSIDQTHVTTLIYGTFGYLDPEYFQSSQFTDKSDVYSFGVVLVELLTGEKAISITRSKEGKSLATYFLISMEEDRLFEILDTRLIKESQNHDRDQIIAVSNLAKKCLNLNGRMRPTMKEVSGELERVRMINNLDGDYNDPEIGEEIRIRKR